MINPEPMNASKQNTSNNKQANERDLFLQKRSLSFACLLFDVFCLLAFIGSGFNIPFHKAFSIVGIGKLSHLITKHIYQSNVQKNKFNFAKFSFFFKLRISLTLKFGNKLHYLETKDSDSSSENVKTR